MKKKKWAKAGILAAVFLAALVVSSLATNRGTDDLTVGMGDPMLPRVAFSVEGRRVNALAGYVDEMDITAMRDTITPLSADGTLEMYLEAGGQEITGIHYEVYSLNGEETYLQDTVGKFSGNTVMLQLSQALPEEVPEAVLRLTLQTGGSEKREIFYYTRIERQDGLEIKNCMDFANDFHEKTFQKTGGDELKAILESDETADNTTLQKVNIHSNLYHIRWGEMSPEISTDVEWSIKESNSVYTSLLAKYQVTQIGDQEEVETYNIREFFRVRCSDGNMYLLNYNRTMNQVFNGNKKVIDKDGILLGIADPNTVFETNKKGTIVSFVQERDLWTYNRNTNELSLVFSFANMEGHDVRSRNDEHEIRIISMEDNGSTTFAVYGYMNRGEHEGRVGVNVYYFDIENNAVEEKAFIPSTKAFAIAEDELGKMVYFNQSQQLLYVLAGGVLYQVDLEKNKEEVLAEDLEEGQYVVSDDGHLMAYQSKGTLNSAPEVIVLNLANGDSYTVAAAQGRGGVSEESEEGQQSQETGTEATGNEGDGQNIDPQGMAVRPLGFVFDDFVCGYVRASDKGTNVAGEEIYPMYMLEIRDTSNKIMKTYSQAGVYLSDVLVEENLVTLNRLSRNEGVYTGIEQDYITNNEERKEENAMAEAYTTTLKEKQMRITLSKGVKELSPEILRPKKVMIDKPITISFDDKVKTDKYYVYGEGRLEAIYDRAAYAIQRAEQLPGVVISSEQSYVWEKGNRDLTYYTETAPFKKGEDQSSVEACAKYMEQFDAKRIDLTGCSLDQVLYIINKGRPVIAMTSSGHAILLTGYSPEDVTYVDPESGEERTVSMEDMNAIVTGGGNTFIGYLS